MFFVLSGFLITSLLAASSTSHRRRRPRRRSGRAGSAACSPRCFLVLARGRALRGGLGAARPSSRRSAATVSRACCYVSNWKFIVDGHVVLPGVPSAVAARAHVVARDRGAVVPALAARADLAMMRVFRHTSAVAAAIVGLALCSASLMAIMFHPGTDPSRVYDGTDTRAQALLVGAALAALTADGTRRSGSTGARGRGYCRSSGVVGAPVLAGWSCAPIRGRVPLPRWLPLRGGRGGRVRRAGDGRRAGRLGAVDPAAGRDRRDLLRPLPLALAGRRVLDETRTGLSGFPLFAAAHRGHRRIAAASYFSSSGRSAATASRRWVVERAAARAVLVVAVGGRRRAPARRFDRWAHVGAEPRLAQRRRRTHPAPPRPAQPAC